MATRRKKKPTIRDVAEAAGVSIATVSNVLKGKRSEVSEATVARILQIVQEMGYVKNLTASSLSSRESRIIAVITIGAFYPGATEDAFEINPFYGEFVFRLEHEARARGYALILYAGREEKYVHFLLQRNVDAAVLVGLTAVDLPSVIRKHDIPLILVDSLVDDGDLMNVRTDEERGGEMSAEHLIARGCKQLAFLGDVPQEGTIIPSVRYTGAKRVCEKAGVPLTLVRSLTSFTSGHTAAKQVLEQGVDGVVTAADVVAAGLVQGLKDLNVAVPKEVAVMGYDNLLISRLVKPMLSTIDQRLDEKILSVMDLVTARAPGALRVVEPRLVIRESA